MNSVSEFTSKKAVVTFWAFAISSLCLTTVLATEATTVVPDNEEDSSAQESKISTAKPLSESSVETGRSSETSRDVDGDPVTDDTALLAQEGSAPVAQAPDSVVLPAASESASVAGGLTTGNQSDESEASTSTSRLPRARGKKEKTGRVKKQSYLVQRVEAVGVDQEMAESMEESIVLEMGRIIGVSVVTSAEMAQTISFSEAKSELGCDEIEGCLVAVRKKLDADFVISSKLGKLGNEFVFTVSVINTRNSQVTRRVSVQGESFSQLRKQVPQLAGQLTGKKPVMSGFRLPDGETLTLAVMPLGPRGVPEATADAMTQILSSELNQIEGVSVLGRDDIDAMMDKMVLETEVGCTDNLECIVEIGAALGLSMLVTGSVGKVKDTFVISLRLIDTRNAEVKSRVLEAFSGDADELKNATKISAYQLVGVKYTTLKGKLDFTFNVDEASVRIGARNAQLMDNHLALGNLVPGRYSLRVVPSSDDFFPFQTDVYVAPDGKNIRTFHLKEKPTKWYKTWWFWTIAGAVVIGAGATTTYFLLRDESDPPGSGTVTVRSLHY